ncbi:acetyltransferase [Neorhizobium galegae]|uniref:Sugar O-acyltransferase, sialic acid O-acetyltransferase NeuD family n=1 Tax=Neorhizobium galegae bv. officinalis TaxID=323656 RepID=A0A0T7H4Q9_NEOGA|nr:acetyltransferase [Neorhizobium galegae]CDZ54516.1 Sugar O-acyltransferase, sialic acid O-acetyltransferase NeuD family [Neorhizobium galegae bv. officinalis]
MKPVIVFGAGDIAEVVDYLFQKTIGRTVAAFTVDGDYVKSDTAFGKPLVAFEEVAARFPFTDYDAFVALSYNKMNVLRAQKVEAMRSAGYNLTSYVSPRATVMTDKIGENCLIFEDNTLQPFCQIGNNVTLWSGNHIGHHSVIEDNVFISSHVVISGGVKVGHNSFIGVNTTVVDHIEIAPFTLLGAGCLVQQSTDAEGVYAPTATIEKRKVPSTRLRNI